MNTEQINGSSLVVQAGAAFERNVGGLYTGLTGHGISVGSVSVS